MSGKKENLPRSFLTFRENQLECFVKYKGLLKMSSDILKFLLWTFCSISSRRTFCLVRIYPSAGGFCIRCMKGLLMAWSVCQGWFTPTGSLPEILNYVHDRGPFFWILLIFWHSCWPWPVWPLTLTNMTFDPDIMTCSDMSVVRMGLDLGSDQILHCWASPSHVLY